MGRNEEMLFFELVQVALGTKDALSRLPSEKEWRYLFGMSVRQAIVGYTFVAVKTLSEKDATYRPPFDLLMKWVASAEQIEGRNRLLNKKCIDVLDELKHVGLLGCVLKGQGNAMMYSQPYSRTPGDIDILIKEAERKHLSEYVRTNKKVTGYHYHHIEYDEEGVSIELHFVPCSANNPIYHRRLQKWFVQTAKKDNIWENKVYLSDLEGGIAVPTANYNLIYQLAHLRHHFFDEGIGLRQMIDYYYLLRKAKDNGRYQTEDVRKILKYLNLYKIAGAVMYIMKEVLGLDEKYLIAHVDERRGKTLLNEILKGGNFGHYSGLDQKNALKKYFQKTWRNMQLVREYPAEALCEPLFRTWHYFWRKLH